MLLFSIINLNTSGTFIFLSYSPLFFIYFVFCIFLFFGLSVWTFTYDLFNVQLIVYITLITLLFLFIEISTDNLYGINETTTLYSTIQYCFLWFILSEAALFLTFFWSSFALNLLVTLEFNSAFNVLPLMYSYNTTNYGFIFYWFYIDLFNIIINTFFLFFSGIFCNYFYLFIYYNSIYCSLIFCFLSLITGFLFIWNQLWEFSLLSFTISTNSFCTNLFSIDILHFSHVSLGVFFIFIATLNIINNQLSNINLIFFTCIVLYWHFVDLVWFILLSFLYFSILSVLFLL